MRQPLQWMLSAALAAFLVIPARASAQSDLDSHIERARAAAGNEHAALFDLLCPVDLGLSRGMPAGLPAVPGEEEWVTRPVRVFDNLFYVGQTEYSAWAIDTGDGLIVIDALFDYSAERSIADGLRELGYDPADIRYLIVSHGHGDHVGGAAHLQSEYGARVVMSEADWEMVEASTPSWPRPRRDIVAEQGTRIELGDVSVELHLTPGHTPGTLSSIVYPIRDGEDRHVAAAWGGTAFNFRGSAEFPRDHWLEQYQLSAERFSEAVEQAGADILIANHPRFDRTPFKVTEVGRAGPHPYVIGTERVQRYLSVAEECAAAARIAESR